MLRIRLYAVVILLAGAFAAADPAPALKQFFNRGEDNILLNPGFENGKAAWTPSETADLTLETLSPGNSLVSGRWDCNSTSDFLDSSIQEVSTLLKGRSCVAEMAYSWPGGVLGHIDFQVMQGSSVLSTTILSRPTGWSTARVEFTCPNSGLLKARLDCQNADPTPITLDDFYLGLNLTDRDGYIKSITNKDYKIMTANFAGGSGTPIVTREEGDWIDTITTTGSGVYIITFDGGTFTGAPSCIANGDGTAGQLDSVCKQEPATTRTAVTVRCITASTGAARDDALFTLWCMGR